MRLSHVFTLALAWGALCVAASAQEAGARRAAEPPPAEAAPRQGAAPQTRPGEESPNTSADGADGADLAIAARVTAGELLFRKVPNPRVEFTGRPRRETVWEADRRNLPQEVQPGVTYRDIGITLRITSVFPDIDRIVAEALGEIPPSDDAPQGEAPRQDAPPGPRPAPPLAAEPSAPAPKARAATPRKGRGR